MIVKTILPRALERLSVIEAGAPVSEAATLMSKPHTDLIVVCDHGDMVGVLTKTDIVGQIGRCMGSGCTARVDSIMTRDVTYCRADDVLLEVWSVMRERGVQRGSGRGGREIRSFGGGNWGVSGRGGKLAPRTGGGGGGPGGIPRREEGGGIGGRGGGGGGDTFRRVREWGGGPGRVGPEQASAEGGGGGVEGVIVPGGRGDREAGAGAASREARQPCRSGEGGSGRGGAWLRVGGRGGGFQTFGGKVAGVILRPFCGVRVVERLIEGGGEPPLERAGRRGRGGRKNCVVKRSRGGGGAAREGGFFWLDTPFAKGRSGRGGGELETGIVLDLIRGIRGNPKKVPEAGSRGEDRARSQR